MFLSQRLIVDVVVANQGIANVAKEIHDVKQDVNKVDKDVAQVAADVSHVTQGNEVSLYYCDINFIISQLFIESL